MANRKLQLNLLSHSGELINCISCFAGQISVFRAPTYSALEIYQRALAGIPGPERMSIFLDDQTFIPSEHFFIGFGEHREGAHEAVLRAFTDRSIDAEFIQNLCASYDLFIDQQTTWNSLSKCEARRVRLLLATLTKNQIIILNDPLEPLANQWRERFAELLLSFAKTSKAIVIVTNLSFRPECWIDNPTIARIQVGEEIQRTIGFGAQGDKGNDLIAQIRELVKDEKKVAELLGTKMPAQPSTAKELPPIPSIPLAAKPRNEEDFVRPAAAAGIVTLTYDRTEIAPEPTFLQKVQPILLNPIYSSLAAAVVIIGGGIYLYSSLSHSSSDHKQIASNQVQVIQEQHTTPEDQSNNQTNTAPIDGDPAPATNPVQNQNPETPQKAVRMVLDEYPPTIKESILVSFQGFGREMSDQPSIQQPNNPAVDNSPKDRSPQSEEAGDLLKLLATASDSGEGLPDAPPPSEQFVDDASENNQPQSFGSEEEKREAIRKRFLEAIERAQNMRRQQSE